MAGGTWRMVMEGWSREESGGGEDGGAVVVLRGAAAAGLLQVGVWSAVVRRTMWW